MGVSLRHLKPGDIFVAVAGSGARAICRITDIDDRVVHGWRMTTQEPLVFDRDTGLGLDEPDRFLVTSVEQPPDDVREALLRLDRRYSVGGSPALSKEELRALDWAR